jgi:hypothetical protein
MLSFQHDGTVTSLMYAMGVNNNLLTPYAAALILELYNTTTGGYEVDVYFRNDTDMTNPWKLQVPGCPTNGGCPLQTFVALMQPQMITSRQQYDQLCNLGQSASSTSPSAFNRGLTQNVFIDILRNITKAIYDFSHPVQ